ncbi:low molecular weight protein arginine phosphatase [Cohnella faecalis]|uniref:Low molecular weight protein arginine phosphatase n=1 Tax=Cohnella faecalis TaxID=2315694 RepID=A0A398CHR2_9BACL|nr:low molecular weight protein arginine phosphatase [Cohnella faecalis]RIE01980.1 low molecular weight protein arginine phosphatase [Cohnella faecalis]
MKRILLVCTGNTCRSPMAEAMLRKMADRAGKKLEVRSAGVSTIGGLPTSPHATETLKRRGIPLPGPSSTLSESETEWANLILTMTSGHKRAIVQRHPEAMNKTFTLKEYALLGEAVMDDLAEAERLYSEWQVRQALGQQLSEKDRSRLMELQSKLPDFDIADPFGGPLYVYEQCADEIEEALRAILGKMDANDD